MRGIFSNHFQAWRVLCFCLLVALVFPRAKSQEGGYANSNSVTVGDTIKFYISTSSNHFPLNIFRIGKERKKVLTVGSVTGGIQATPDSAYAKGCNWNLTYAMIVPDSWSSGVYYAQFPTTAGTLNIPFVVRPLNPGSTSGILFCIGINTLQAYNNFGGKSLYGFNSTGGIAATSVSFNRPLNTVGDLVYDNNLSAWLENNNIQVEYCSFMDLDADPSLLSHYSFLTTCGHDEYWSAAERTSIESFVAAGGKYACLGGNTCWWQIRFEDNLRTLTCYRYAILDPVATSNPSLTTVNWFSPPVNNPENTFLGVSYRNGGYVNSHGLFLRTNGYGGYGSTNSQHWAFQGTGLADGNVFGAPDTIVGYETDGATFRWSSGLPVVNGLDQTPLNFKILALSPAGTPSPLPHHATMGIYRNANGGMVFNAATVNWSGGLKSNPVVQQITKNVFKRFSSNFFPPEINGWAPFTVRGDSVNHEWFPRSDRDTALWAGQTIPFSVSATDPQGGVCQFQWYANGILVGTDSVYSYTMPDGAAGKTVLLAKILNAQDTSSISWTVGIKQGPPTQIPIPAYPLTESIGQPVQSAFGWSRIVGVTGYQIQVSPDSTFQTTPAFESIVADTTCQVQLASYFTRYFWRVRGINTSGYGTWSIVSTFTTLPMPAPAPTTLENPAPFSLLPTGSIRFTWTKSALADSYNVQVSTDSTFSSPLIVDSTLTDTTIVGSFTQHSTTYFWRVRTSNVNGTSVSATHSLTTYPEIPDSNPLLISPENGLLGIPLASAGTWTHVAGATEYNLQLGTDSTWGSDIVLDAATEDTTIAFIGLEYSTQYFWRIRAANITGAGSWTPNATFRTADRPPPSVPIVISPAESTVDVLLPATFRWFPSLLASRYEVQLNTDSLWKTTNPQDSMTTDTMLIVGGLNHATTYYWRVRAFNDTTPGEWSLCRFFVSSPPVPSESPQILYPSSESGNSPVQPGLLWSSATGATSYQLQIGTDSSWHSGVVFDSIATDTTMTSASLHHSTRYFWRVRGLNVTGSGSWSSTTAFLTIAPPAPSVPSPLNAAVSANGQSFQSIFSWGADSLADTYHLQVGTDSTMESALAIDTTITDTTITLDNLSFSTMYYWRVRGLNGPTEGNWSLIALYETPLLPAPLIIEPAAGTSNLPSFLLFTWHRSHRAATYQIQIGSDTSWNSGVVRDTIVGDSVVVVEGLDRNTTYQWRVRAIGRSAPGEWTSSIPFSTSNDALPIELGEFTGHRSALHAVILEWSTLTETNALSFTVQRRTEGQLQFHAVGGTIAAAGTSLEHHQYTFTDTAVPDGTFYYRLKQMDADGAVQYSTEIKLIVDGTLGIVPNHPLEFKVSQNYPNPFNPATTVSFEIPEASFVTLDIYNVLGQLVVRILDNQFVSPGDHDAVVDGTHLSSGVYYYSVTSTGNGKITRAIGKMLLSK